MREQIFDRFVRGEGPADTAARHRHRPRPGDRQRRRRLPRRHASRRCESESGGALFRARIPLAEF